MNALKLTNTSHVGSIPGCTPLGAADIGKGKTNAGKTVYFAWGRNWTEEQAEQRGADIVMPVVDIGQTWGNHEPSRNYSPIISFSSVERLLTIMECGSGGTDDEIAERIAKAY